MLKLRNWVKVSPEKATEKDENAHILWIVPATFCAIRYINESRYFHGDTILEFDRVNKERNNSVNFCKVNLNHHLKIVKPLGLLVFKPYVIMLSEKKSLYITTKNTNLWAVYSLVSADHSVNNIHDKQQVIIV